MLESVEEKECTLCKKVQPIAEFVSEYAPGYTNRCGKCRSQGQRAHSKYVAKNKDRVNQWHADYSRKRQSAEPAPGLIRCPRCWAELPPEQFPIGPNGQRKKMCTECRAYYAMHQVGWRKRYPDKSVLQKGKAIQKRKDDRRKCLEHYGLACSCCGEAHYEFLTMDHIDGRGCVHRREIPSESICRWLIKHGFPPGFRTLCWNCNWGCRLNNGICPHQLEKQVA